MSIKINDLSPETRAFVDAVSSTILSAEIDGESATLADILSYNCYTTLEEVIREAITDNIWKLK